MTEKTVTLDAKCKKPEKVTKKVKPTTRSEEQKNLLKVLNRVASEFEWRRSIPLETVQLISKRVSKFDAEKINWPRVVNIILKGEEDEHSALGSRHAIWKVLGLLMIDYEAEESRMIDDLVALISDAAYEDFSDKLRRFIARYLRDRVSF